MNTKVRSRFCNIKRLKHSGHSDGVGKFFSYQQCKSKSCDGLS